MLATKSWTRSLSIDELLLTTINELSERTHWIKELRSEGTAEDVKELERMLQWEEEVGERVPSIMIGRLEGRRDSQWLREHTKAYVTPTILDEWKNSLPVPVAVWFFHECNVIAIKRPSSVL
jgi:hypothetical protein